MCELLGMNANVPTDIRFSFSGFAPRGGAVRPDNDGWGIAFYDERAARIVHDQLQRAASDLARFVLDRPIGSLNVIVHVRPAAAGKKSMLPDAADEDDHFSTHSTHRSIVLRRAISYYEMQDCISSRRR